MYRVKQEELTMEDCRNVIRVHKLNCIHYYDEECTAKDPFDWWGNQDPAIRQNTCDCDCHYMEYFTELLFKTERIKTR